jgi:mannose-6-phosphate isomerase-like protein (cupin superfamily)
MEQMDNTVLNREDVPRVEHTYEFQGYKHLNTKISFLGVDMPPGGAVHLHKHPYKEIFIVQQGIATFTVGSTNLEVSAGQVVIVPAEIPHKFRNAGDRQLQQVDIHVNEKFIIECLEE